MKKILSFLAKKPLALAAVALFSMSSYAADESEATTPKQTIWAKVTDFSTLTPFQKVTVVDETGWRIYTAKNGVQVVAEEFEVGGDADKNGTPFYVCEGKVNSNYPDDKVFSLNTESDGTGKYLFWDGSLVSRTINAEVSWLQDISKGIFSESMKPVGYYLYFDAIDEQGRGTDMFSYTNSAANAASLYAQKEVFKPTFEPEEGIKKNVGDGIEVTINNPNKNADGREEGTLKWRFKGDKDWNDYTEPVPVTEKDKEVTIEAKIVFGENVETKPVEATYLLTDIAAPVITPPTGEYKVENDGTAPVTITDATEGAAISYYTKDADATVEEPTWSTYDDKNKPDVADYANSEKQVTVTAKASKEVTFKGKKETVYSEETSETYTVVPNATPEDLFTDLKSEPQNGAQVNGGQTVYLWFELLPDLTGDFANYEIEPNTEVAKKDLELTFKGKTEPVKAPASIVPLPGTKDKYVVSFVVPVGKDYVNTEFDVAVPEGFYKATSGKNVVLTEAGTVHYTTGLGAVPYYVEMPNMLLPTDATSVTVKIYPFGQKDAVVNFVDDKDPVKGVQFGNSIDELETPVEKIEKTGEPNTFTVTFTNKEGQNEFIQKWILNEDGQINEKGFVIGFPDNTFVSDDMANGDQISTHINFYEAIDFKIESEEWNLCEGSEDIVITVTGTGSLTGKEFDVQLVEGKIATITGTDWRGNAVSRKATISTITPEVMDKHNIAADANTDNMYVVTFGEFKLPEDYGYIADDEDHPYTMTIPAGTFTSNNDTNEEVTKNVNIMAHPVWAVEAEPYTYDEGKNSASTITLKITATLDDTFFKGPDMDKKLYEKPLRVRDQEIEILVDGKAAEWELKNVVTDEMRTANGMLYQTGEIVLTLAEPIKDVKKHTIKINKGALKANACRNPEMIVDVYPYVKYGIDKAYYVVPTTQKSVPYSIYGELPDGSRLPAGVIEYVGETENPEVTNAVAYNNQKEKPTDVVEYRFPTVASTEAGVSDVDGEDVTVFTIEFTPGQLWVANFQMNFPVGTVQAKGYNANEGLLYNNFDVLPALDYDATSSFADYMEPAKEDKEKEYFIGTDAPNVTLYLTAVDLTNPYDANFNKGIELEEGTPLTITNDDDGTEIVVTDWKKVVDKKTGEISYTVPFPESDVKDVYLAEGVYTLTVPEETVAPTVLKDFTEGTPLNIKNPDPFELKIYVEDFAADKAIEITTKQYAFEVTVPGLTEVLVPTASFDDGTAATLSKVKDGVMLVTIGGAKPLVKGAEHNFLHSGDYVLTIPAGAFKGQYATSYEDIDVDVKVIFEFADYGIEEESYPEYKDLTTTTEDEVLDEKGDHIKMYFSRQFKTTNYQGLAVPFDLTQEEVKDYFTIYRIQTVTVADNGDFKLNFVTVGEDGTAYANKPYVIKPVAAGLVQIELLNVEEPKYVEEPEVADDVWAATTMVKFDFFNTIGAKEFTEPVGILGTQDGVLGFSVDNYACSPWRWYMTSSDKKIKYIKIAINGVDVDDATAIDFVEALEGNTQIFNVAGQRLNAPAKGKVNIINGKKVLVK